MTSAQFVFCIYLLKLLINVSKETNSVDPDQVAPTGAVQSGPALFNQEDSKFQQTTKSDDICCNWRFKS